MMGVFPRFLVFTRPDFSLKVSVTFFVFLCVCVCCDLEHFVLFLLFCFSSRVPFNGTN